MVVAIENCKNRSAVAKKACSGMIEHHILVAVESRNLGLVVVVLVDLPSPL